MNSTNSDDVIKSLLNVLKCLTNVLDKVLEMVLTFLPRLIILKKRVEKWFIKLVSALVTIVNYLILPRMPIQYLRWNTTSNMRLSSIRPSRGYLFCQKDSKRTCCLLCWWKGPKMTPPFLIFFFFLSLSPLSFIAVPSWMNLKMLAKRWTLWEIHHMHVQCFLNPPFPLIRSKRLPININLDFHLISFAPNRWKWET